MEEELLQAGRPDGEVAGTGLAQCGDDGGQRRAGGQQADAGKAAVRVERADVDDGVLLFEPDALFAAGVAALAECLVAQQAAARAALARYAAIDDGAGPQQER